MSLHPPKTKQDARLKDFKWRARVGFDNIAKALWRAPQLGLFYSRKRRRI